MRHPSLAALLLVALGAALTAGAAYAHGPGHPRHPRPPKPLPPVDVVQPVTAGFQVELLDEAGRSLPTFYHGGRRYVLGSLGHRYRLHIVNPTPSRVEAVVSVDGLDAIDGNAASLSKRGYIVPAFDQVTVDGFRTSVDTVAAFRFSSVPDSYAGRKGDDRNVGVIGVAFFRERVYAPPPPRPIIVPRPSARAPLPEQRSSPAPSGGGTAAGPQKQRSRAGDAAESERPGLGTAFGEERLSRIQFTTFERASASPSAVVQVRYDDRDGLRALGIRIPPDPAPREDDLYLRETAQPFPGVRFAEPPP